MREILFRGKRLDNNEWIEGYYVFRDIERTDKIQYHCILVRDMYGFVWREVDSESLSQYAELKDKNNVRIFEGDIISVKNEVGEIYRFEVKFGKFGGTENVEHDVGYIGFYFQPIPKRIECEYILRKDPLYWINEYECEVIGNVYDNQEFLKEAN